MNTQNDDIAIRSFRSTDIDPINDINNGYVETGHAVFDEAPRSNEGAKT